MSHLSEAQILRFLVQLTVLLLVSRTLGDLMKRLGQAPVIGELLAGVIVGPSVLGNLAPDLFAACFGGDPMSRHLLEAFAWTGAILLLLYIGLETDLDILARPGTRRRLRVGVRDGDSVRRGDDAGPGAARAISRRARTSGLSSRSSWEWRSQSRRFR